MIFDRTLIRFVLVGLVNTVVASIIMFSLYNIIDLSYWLSSAVTYILVSVLSFFLNKNFTFRSNSYSFRTIIAFILTIAVSYIIAYSAAKPLVFFILKNSGDFIQGNVSLLVGMCFFTVMNYTGQKFFVFKKVVSKPSTAVTSSPPSSHAHRTDTKKQDLKTFTKILLCLFLFTDFVTLMNVTKMDKYSCNTPILLCRRIFF